MHARSATSKKHAKKDNGWVTVMKKAKKFILQTATLMAAIALCVGVTVARSQLPSAYAEGVLAGTQVLDDKKAEAKAELAAYFNAFSESDYAAAEWAELDRMQREGNAFIDEATDAEEIKEIVAGIKYAADGILTEAEKPAFATYVAQASVGVEQAFNASLYREAEAAEGAAIVANAKEALANATTYAEAEALELSALADIAALKTAAQWEAEEAANANKNESNESKPEGEEDRFVPREEEGCGSVASGVLQTLLLAGLSSMIMIKNKKKEQGK